MLHRFETFAVADPGRMPHLPRSSCADYRLTPQERHLLDLLIEGHHKKTAAQAMGISINTVSFHLKNIYLKLNVHSKTEAVVKVLREDLTVSSRVPAA
jgi:DNA-binding CsgD family transcriptional regulator